MACAIAGDDFDSWLIVKLKALNTDETVFSSYIKGILEGDETEEEKNESLEEILSEITESRISSLREEILQRWQTFSSQKQEEQEAAAAQNKPEDVDERLVRLMESQAKSTIPVRNYTDEERRLKEAILSQYGHVADQEDEEEEEEVAVPSGLAVEKAAANKGGSKGAGIERNTNFEDVQRADKDRRERAKQEAIQKKEKDKEDREKQKQAQQEKKEKRKTQKGERRR
ncbi:coiled-coil domain-containing protein 43 [Neocloeon triangulifer]|uniref:coiled-coil domain-containing protein 43 n=1 Tax=Neocloeon triangulifer TaxID=2078957 RepID=UPI00286EBA75|nr:coiled-coil domain-containing protein 43 [Neocloeon triangulifer]